MVAKVDAKVQKTATKTAPAQKAATKKKQPAAVETSLSIAEQTKMFLQAGGEIQQIESGVSGKPSMGTTKGNGATDQPAKDQSAKK